MDHRPVPTAPGAAGPVAPAGAGDIAGQLKEELKALLLDTKLNLLLVLIPFAFISYYAHWSDGVTFVLSLLALCPLAERLGFITEQLAFYTNDTLGGLLNASFGNATEVIIAGFALKNGYVRIVQLTLYGSVVSNLLLVMGSAFLIGGTKHKHQYFNIKGVNVNASLLMLSVMMIALPSLIGSTGTEAGRTGDTEVRLSRYESLLMLAVYGLFLLFQLKTHAHLYEEGDYSDKEARDGPSTSGGNAANGNAEGSKHGSAAGGSSARPTLERQLSSSREPDATGRVLKPLGSLTRRSTDMELGLLSSHGNAHTSSSPMPLLSEGGTPKSDAHPDDKSDKSDGSDDEEIVLSKWGCFFWLSVATLLISFLSDFLMDAVADATEQLHIPLPFLVTIVVPIVGNAAEHASAIIFAYKNRLDISLGVAVGSSTQVATLLIPFCVILAWMMGQPLSMDFNTFEAASYSVVILLAIICIIDGSSNWLKGLVLITTYLLLAGGFWCHKDNLLEAEGMDGI